MTNYYYEGDLPDNLNLGKEIALDTETLGLNNYRDRLCMIQLSSGNGDAHLVHFKTNNYEAKNLRRLLEDESVLKIMHFARFDMAIILKTFGILMKNIYCTKIASKIARTYTDTHGLKVLIKEFMGVDISKREQSSYWGGDVSEEQIKYAANDVLFLHEIKGHLENILTRENRHRYFEECIKFLPTRVELDLAGWLDMDIFCH